jgi:hypothetical protein
MLFSVESFSNEWFFKLYGKYHTPLTYQQMPAYFTDQVYVPVYLSGTEWNIIAENSKFSLASGMSYGVSAGCFFNKLIGIELSFESFSINKTFESDNYELDSTSILGKASWKFKSFKVMPTLLFRKEYKKSEIIAKIGPLIGFDEFDKKINGQGYTNSYQLFGGLGFGYNIGVEYQHELSSRFHLSIEIGMEDHYYTPKKAMQMAWSYQLAIVQNIEYEKEFERYKNPAYYNVPMRLSETLRLNSMYCSFGIVYKI